MEDADLVLVFAVRANAAVNMDGVEHQKNIASIERGCQSEFGDCTGKERNVNVATEKVNKSENTIAYSDSDRCGKNEGRCRNDECCSKYGWCGTTKSYCSKDKGCQSEFGRCW